MKSMVAGLVRHGQRIPEASASEVVEWEFPKQASRSVASAGRDLPFAGDEQVVICPRAALENGAAVNPFAHEDSRCGRHNLERCS